MDQTIKFKKSGTPEVQAIHMSEGDREDLERFRALMKRLSPAQIKMVADLMLERPDTP